jgi:hypothetical protein
MRLKQLQQNREEGEGLVGDVCDICDVGLNSEVEEGNDSIEKEVEPNSNTRTLSNSSRSNNALVHNTVILLINCLLLSVFIYYKY